MYNIVLNSTCSIPSMGDMIGQLWQLAVCFLMSILFTADLSMLHVEYVSKHVRQCISPVDSFRFRMPIEGRQPLKTRAGTSMIILRVFQRAKNFHHWNSMMDQTPRKSNAMAHSIQYGRTPQLIMERNDSTSPNQKQETTNSNHKSEHPVVTLQPRSHPWAP